MELTASSAQRDGILAALFDLAEELLDQIAAR
jgi:hypothetical protein